MLKINKFVANAIRGRVLALLGVVIIGSSLFGATQVLAQANNGSYPSFVQELAQKLGIDQSKVQQAVDQIRLDHKSQMQSRLNTQLDQAVKDGKITQTQKTSISNKLQEMKNNRHDMNQFKNQTPQQRRLALEQKKTEFENWAKQNGLTLQTLQEILGHSGKGFRMGGMRGLWK